MACRVAASSNKLAEFLNQARKYRVGLIFAHQFPYQLDNVSINLRESAIANTSIKIMAKLETKSARGMAEIMGVDKNDFKTLKINTRKIRPYTEFLCYIRDITQRAVKIRVPLGTINKKKRMPDEHYKKLLEMNSAKLIDGGGIPTQDKSDRPKETETSDRRPEKKELPPRPRLG